jgi:DNA replication protein DnaC
MTKTQPSLQRTSKTTLSLTAGRPTKSDFGVQVISQRYEHGSIVQTTNRIYKEWPEIFNNDATLTSAVLDRLLHHADTVPIEGKSYPM